MTEKEVVIPDEIQEIMSYLAYTFSRTMNSPIYSSEDLFNDMVVLYLENYNSTKIIKKPKDKNHWFTFFKSRMIDRYKRLRSEKRILDKLIQEYLLNG